MLFKNQELSEEEKEIINKYVELLEALDAAEQKNKEIDKARMDEILKTKGRLAWLNEILLKFRYNFLLKNPFLLR